MSVSMSAAMSWALQPGENPDVDQAKDAVTYWGVPDAEDAYTKLLALGAKPYQAVQEVGGGIKLGAVMDPIGNRLGVIENPHFVAARFGEDAGEGEPGLTFSLHIGQTLLKQIKPGARSAGVSLEEYVGECAVDGLIRGYR